jgi:hypothetical protein
MYPIGLQRSRTEKPVIAASAVPGKRVPGWALIFLSERIVPVIIRGRHLSLRRKAAKRETKVGPSWVGINSVWGAGANLHQREAGVREEFRERRVGF